MNGKIASPPVLTAEKNKKGSFFLKNTYTFGKLCDELIEVLSLFQLE